MIKEMELNLPNLFDQMDIVENLDNLEAKCSELRDNYNRRLTAFDALKKSLLQKAFAGELT